MDLAKHIKPLSGELDWPMWKRKIRDLLDYHEGALDAIDGRLVKPEPLTEEATESEKKEYKKKSDLYRKANSYAKSMITSAVTDSVYHKIMDKESARDAWEALRLHFEASSKDQLFKVCTDFFSFCWTLGEDVSTHTAKLRSLWNELNNGLTNRGEDTLPDLMLICKTLHILPSSFETFRSSWMLLTKNEDKTFDELVTQLCMYERNFTTSAKSDKKNTEALVAKVNKKEGNPNMKHSRKNDTCNYCKKKGHWVISCRKWIADGRPAKETKVQSSVQGNAATTSLAIFSVPSEVCAVNVESTSDWWIDNGATRHVTNCSEYFVDFKEFEDSRCIHAAGKETLQAVGKGSIRILSTVDNTCQELTLSDVWYVPKISRNLFSVLAAQDRNQNSEFKSTATVCKLELDGKTVLSGVRELGGTLFKASIKPIIPEPQVGVNFAFADSSTLQLYHERWGHQDKRYVKVLLERDLGIKVRLDKGLCEPCIYGKAHRLPFGTRETAKEPGELVSADICGPFDESFQKKRYLLVFKDNYTKFRYGYIIKEKSEAKDALKHMIAHAKASGHTIRELLSDNGGEFDNENVRQFLCENGITQRLTAPYTPERNGGSERENRTVNEMARTFKYQILRFDFLKQCGLS